MYSLRGNQDPAPKAVLLFLDCFSLFFASPPFPDQQLFEPALWNSEKVTQRGFCAQEFHRVLLDLNTRFSLILLNPEENRYWTRRGIIILDREVKNKCFPGGVSGKETACQCRRCRFDLWVRKIPWQPTPVFLPGESHGPTEKSGRLWSIGSHRVRHTWSNLAGKHVNHKVSRGTQS